MITLGISAIDKDSALCILRDTEILYAVSEESLTRKKRQDGFPTQALEEGLRITGLSLSEIDAICHPVLTTTHEQKIRRGAAYKNFAYVLGQNDYPLSRRLMHLANSIRTLPFSNTPETNRELESELANRGALEKLQRYHYQMSHAASSFYTVDAERALIVSFNGDGCGLAGGFFLGEGGRIKLLQGIDSPHSMVSFYEGMARSLNVPSDRRDSKIHSLASNGDPSILFGKVLRRFDTSAPETFRIIDPHNILFEYFISRRYSREDIAAAYQAVLEDVVIKYVAQHAKRVVTDTVCLTGTLCTNTKLNQRIAEINGIKTVHVYPGTNNAGTALGACLLHVAAKNGGLRPNPLNSVLRSRDFHQDRLKRSFSDSGLAAIHCSNGSEPYIATPLNQKPEDHPAAPN